MTRPAAGQKKRDRESVRQRRESVRQRDRESVRVQRERELEIGREN